MRVRKTTLILAAVLLTIGAGRGSAEQAVIQPDFPDVPSGDQGVPDWLPGIWQPQVYAPDGDSVSRVGGFRFRYRFSVADDGSLEVARWQEILPVVEVAFFDGDDCVLRESWAGEVREFSLDLESMTPVPLRPRVTGILRVVDQDDPKPGFYRVVWLKLRNDFFDGPL